MKRTTVSLSEETKKQLEEFADRKGESFDTILQRVISDASEFCKCRSKTKGESPQDE